MDIIADNLQNEESRRKKIEAVASESYALVQKSKKEGGEAKVEISASRKC